MGGCHVQPEQMFDLIWGYHDTLHVLATANAAGTSVTISFAAVPSDEVWWIQYITYQDTLRQSTPMVAAVMEAGANQMDVAVAVPPGTSWTSFIKSDIVIKNPAFMRVFGYACVNLDPCKAWLHGYKMKLTQ